MLTKKALLFDFGGVLFSIQPPISPDNAKRFREMKQLVINTCDPETSTRESLYAALLGREYQNFSLKERKQIYESLTVINSSLLTFLRELAKKYKIFGLINEAPTWTELRMNLFHLKDVFQKVYVSSEIGFEKPDPRAFEYFLSDSGLMAKDCIFVDDSISNCKAAQALGFPTIRFMTNEQFGKELEICLEA